jgi:hypothetical protein
MDSFKGVITVWSDQMFDPMVSSTVAGFVGGWISIPVEKPSTIGDRMAENSRHEAAIPNPALKPLSVLIGNWNTVGTHALVPGTTFHGYTSFAWLEAELS